MSAAQSSHSKIMLVILICLLVAGVIILAGSSHGMQLNGYPIFLVAGCIPLLLHWLVFVPAYHWQTEHYFDLTGAISFITAILLANWLGNGLAFTQDIRSQLLSLMVLTWSLRLGSFLFMRVKRSGEDRRFRDIKTKFLRFLLTWTLGGVWVLITVAPALAAITSARQVALNWLAYAGIALWLAGLLIEVVADRQKSAFRARPENRDRFINTGLWSLSRHPNYLGEMALWIGVALLAAPVLQGWQYVTLISPVFVILLLCRVSGIPLLEARAQEKWGDEPTYQDYVQHTAVLIPGLHTKSQKQ